MDGNSGKNKELFVFSSYYVMPKLRYWSGENVKSADTVGVLQRLRVAFERIGIKNLEDSVVGLIVDGASVYNGTKRGLWVLIKQEAPRLELFHCLNRRLELDLKDGFDNSLFDKIDTIFTKL